MIITRFDGHATVHGRSQVGRARINRIIVYRYIIFRI